MSKGTNPWVFLPLVAFVALAVLLASGLGRNPEELPSALAGKPVPEFSRPSLLNDRTLTEELLTGRWQLLNVWGTWCPECWREHDYLMALKRRGVTIVGINWRDEANEAKGGEPVKGQLEVLDPVCGKPVMASELTLMAPEEVDAFLKEWAK